MRIVGLIPARGGSKRLPGKNIKPLGGLPLIAWTIRAAEESGCCTEILVSTDDPAIAHTAREHGASVPWLRPAELSTDTATSVDVAIHALDFYEANFGLVDGLLLLQPTSPFRSAQTIRRAAELFEQGNCHRAVVSVGRSSCHPAWTFRISDGGMAPFLGWDSINKRSQDLEPAWMLDGSIYLIAPERLRAERTFLPRDTSPLLVVEGAESIDIDTPQDWMVAESFLPPELRE